MRYYTGLAVLACVIEAVVGDVANTTVIQCPTNAVLRARGYNAGPLKVRGSIEPGGEIMSFEGTIEEIESQIQQVKSDFSWDQFEPAKIVPQGEEDQDEKGGYEARLAKRRPVKVKCPTERGLAYGERRVLEEAVETYRRDSMGFPIDALGCHPVSCANGTGLWVCNPDRWSANVMGIDASIVMDGILADDSCRDPEDAAMLQAEAHYEGIGWSVVFGGCTC